MLRLAGVVAVVAGLVLAIPGLLVAGGLWLACGLLIRRLVRSEPTGTAGLPARPAAPSAPTVAPGPLALLAAAGVPTLALAIGGAGFPADDEAWRYATLAVGGLLTAWALLGCALWALSRALR
jgi:hypothetical protein